MFLLFQITPELFSSIGGALESQKCLFKTLLDMLLESKSSDLTSLIKDCLQRVSAVFVGRHVHICLLNMNVFNHFD